MQILYESAKIGEGNKFAQVEVGGEAKNGKMGGKRSHKSPPETRGPFYEGAWDDKTRLLAGQIKSVSWEEASDCVAIERQRLAKGGGHYKREGQTEQSTHRSVNIHSSKEQQQERR